MRKLFEITQDNLIVCDNEHCDFKVINETKDPNVDIKPYLNKPCPKCGKILLTEKDYKDSLKFMKIVNFSNKWFSWLTFFIPKSKNEDATIQIHEGIKIKK